MPRHRPHHPLHHETRHHDPEWFFNVVKANLTPQEISAYLVNIGEKINDGSVKINNDEVTFPDNDLELTLRHERAPRGEFVFKIEVKWSEGSASSNATDELDIG